MGNHRDQAEAARCHGFDGAPVEVAPAGYSTPERRQPVLEAAEQRRLHSHVLEKAHHLGPCVPSMAQIMVRIIPDCRIAAYIMALTPDVPVGYA